MLTVRPTNMDELIRLWREHSEAEYPDGYRDKEVAGISLILLDADTGGYVAQCLGGAHLDSEHAAALQRCYRDLDAVTRELMEPARAYFERLKRMAAIVLGTLGRATRAV